MHVKITPDRTEPLEKGVLFVIHGFNLSLGVYICQYLKIYVKFSVSKKCLTSEQAKGSGRKA
jgi:hypothetical protein